MWVCGCGVVAAVTLILLVYMYIKMIIIFKNELLYYLV